MNTVLQKNDKVSLLNLRNFENGQDNGNNKKKKSIASKHSSFFVRCELLPLLIEIPKGFSREKNCTTNQSKESLDQIKQKNDYQNDGKNDLSEEAKLLVDHPFCCIFSEWNRHQDDIENCKYIPPVKVHHDSPISYTTINYTYSLYIKYSNCQ